MKFLLLSVAAAAAASASGAVTWSNIGPDGGEARILAADTRSIYVMNRRSGVFRSDDGGASWSVAFDAVQRGVLATALGVDPITSAVYIGTTSGLYHGESLVRGGGVFDVAANHDRVYLAAADGLYVSHAGGSSWMLMAGPPVAVLTSSFRLRIDPRSTSTLYAAGGGQLFRTADDGATWETLQATNIVAFAFDDALYAGGSSGVYRCDSECTPIAFDAVVDLAIWRGVLFAATDRGVLRRANSDWQSVNDGLPEAPVVSLAATPAALFAGTTAGVYRTDDGVRWSIASRGLTNVRIARLALRSGELIAATAGQGVLRRVNGEWQDVSQALPRHPPAAPLATAIASNDSTIYLGFLGDGVFRSDDGASWMDVSGGLPSRDVRDLAVDGTTVFAATLGGLARSIDSGATWQSLAAFPSAFADAVAVRGAQVIGAAGAFAYSSSDAGLTWTTATLPAVIIETALTNSGSFLATDHGIFASMNGGHHWNEASSGMPGGGATLVKALATDGSRLFAAAESAPGSVSDLPAGIYLFDGMKWTPVAGSDALPRDITSLAIDSTILYAGTNGGSIFATSLAPRRRAVTH